MTFDGLTDSIVLLVTQVKAMNEERLDDRVVRRQYWFCMFVYASSGDERGSTVLVGEFMQSTLEGVA